jgi:hypothetical protein
MGHSRRVGPIRSAYDDAERITIEGYRGTWRDSFTLAGAPAVDHIPASTLYYLFGAFVELERR